MLAERKGPDFVAALSPILARYLFILALVAICLGFAGPLVSSFVQTSTLDGKVHANGDQTEGIATATVWLERDITTTAGTTTNGEFEFNLDGKLREAKVWAKAPTYAPGTVQH